MLIKLIYLGLAAAMFYFTQGAISAGGFGFMYRYLFGMAIVALAMAAMLFHPRMRRLKTLGKGVLVLSASYAVTVLWSALIWIKEIAPLKTMTRGFFFPFYQVIGIFAAAATLYLFGKNGIWYCLLGMCLGNGIIVLLVVAKGGVGPFIEELILLLTTFGEITGAMMHETEVHDLTFAFGPFAVLLALYPEPKKKGWWLACAVVGFFLLVGLKRIEIGAIGIAVALCFLLKKMQSETARRVANLICVFVLLASFVYIIAIHGGLFDYLETMGMDTKGRDMLYRYVALKYEISPAFMGRGLGFSSEPWDLTGLIGPEWRGVHQDAYHNEFVRMYVEVGFFGYIAWFIFYLPVRVNYLWKHGGQRAGVLALCYSIYCMITYATDNTLYYYYTNLATFILMLYELLREEPEGDDYELESGEGESLGEEHADLSDPARWQGKTAVETQ